MLIPMGINKYLIQDDEESFHIVDDCPPDVLEKIKTFDEGYYDMYGFHLVKDFR